MIIINMLTKSCTFVFKCSNWCAQKSHCNSCIGHTIEKCPWKCNITNGADHYLFNEQRQNAREWPVYVVNAPYCPHLRRIHDCTSHYNCCVNLGSYIMLLLYALIVALVSWSKASPWCIHLFAPQRLCGIFFHECSSFCKAVDRIS
jgi:hypothetical protein